VHLAQPATSPLKMLTSAAQSTAAASARSEHSPYTEQCRDTDRLQMKKTVKPLDLDRPVQRSASPSERIQPPTLRDMDLNYLH
jgi:hypothetical protein